MGIIQIFYFRGMHNGFDWYITQFEISYKPACIYYLDFLHMLNFW